MDETLNAELESLVREWQERQRAGGCGTMCHVEHARELQAVINRHLKTESDGSMKE